MVNKVDTLNLLEAGVKASSVRQAAIANNIANMDSPNFRRSDVDFGKVLESAMKGVSANAIEPKLIQPQDTAVDSKGNDVNIDMEVGAMMKNDGAQKTYLRLIAKTYSQMELAIKDQS